MTKSISHLHIYTHKDSRQRHIECPFLCSPKITCQACRGWLMWALFQRCLWMWCVCACVYVYAVSPVIMARWHSLSTSSEKYLGAPFGYRPWIDPATASPSLTLCSSRDLLGLLGCRNDGILVLFIPGTRLHLSHAWMLKEHVTPLKQRRVKYYAPRKDVRAFFLSCQCQFPEALYHLRHSTPVKRSKTEALDVVPPILHLLLNKCNDQQNTG